MILDPLKNFKIGYKLAILASFFFTLPYRIFKPGRVKFGKNFVCKWDLKIKGPGKVIFGDNVNAWTNHEKNRFQTYSKEATIKVGLNSRINGAFLHSRKEVNIGSDVVLGSTEIIDTEFHSIVGKRNEILNSDVKSSAVSLRSKVWVGGKSAILKGSNIGKNSIIGYGSVVRGNIPANSVVIGNPAQIVKKLDS